MHLATSVLVVLSLVELAILLVLVARFVVAVGRFARTRGHRWGGGVAGLSVLAGIVAFSVLFGSVVSSPTTEPENADLGAVLLVAIWFVGAWAATAVGAFLARGVIGWLPRRRSRRRVVRSGPRPGTVAGPSHRLVDVGTVLAALAFAAGFLVAGPLGALGSALATYTVFLQMATYTVHHRRGIPNQSAEVPENLDSYALYLRPFDGEDATDHRLPLDQAPVV